MDDKSVGSSAPEGEISPIPAHLAHVPAKCLAGLAAAHADKPLARFTGTPEVILSRLRNGENVTTVAAELEVSRTALYAWLLRNCAEEFMAISAGRSLSRIEQAETDLDAEESDQLKVTKARESARLAQWTLERASRRLFGDSKVESGGVTVQVLIVRDGETHTVIEDSAA